MSGDDGNPAVQGRRLRTAIREARDKAGLTQDQVAKALDWSLSKVVRIEAGSVKLSITDLRALLDLYKITDQDRVAELESTAKAARRRAWWAKYRGLAPEKYLEFVEFEQAASAALNFEPLWVPGLLQTRDYAHEIIRRLGPESDAKAKGLLDFRMERQRRLFESSERPQLSFVLDESVVRRSIGDARVMSAQLSHLVELADRPYITLQVLPFAAELTFGMHTPFVIHQFRDPADPAVLYLEGALGDTIVADDKDEVDRYRRAFTKLQRLSLSEHESVKFLLELASGHK
jgi:transcriptional regulator with XRE-family HTH domain